MTAPLAWLLEGEPWIVYRTRRDLLRQDEQEATVCAARRAMLENGRINVLLTELREHPDAILSSHKSAGQPFHKLNFLADLGLVATDPGMEPIIDNVLVHQSQEGPFQLPMMISPAHGGTGTATLAWALCDAPLLVRALACYGLGEEPRVQAAARYLVGLGQDYGYPCVVSKELGSFRGPGRKHDPCPYATLVMLKMMIAFPPLLDSVEAHAAAECLLRLWHERRTQHPYMFYMGTDFCALKVPFVWYDLLHVLDVLSQCAWLHADPRLQEMGDILSGKADSEGRFTADSVWMAWKDWEFGQKKQPSRWLTLLAWRILRRLT